MEASSSKHSRDLGRNENIREISIPEAIGSIADTDGEFDWVSSLTMLFCRHATSASCRTSLMPGVQSWYEM
jgi:hypothetical protein